MPLVHYVVHNNRNRKIIKLNVFNYILDVLGSTRIVLVYRQVSVISYFGHVVAHIFRPTCVLS